MKQALQENMAVRPMFDDPDRPLTVTALREVMPKRQKINITDSLVRELNLLVDDPEARSQFRENILGYTDVLRDPNIKLDSYVQAVKYVSYKLLGYTNQESWIKTFPERYKRLMDRQAAAVYIRGVICAYNRGKTVNKILEQTMVPVYVLNQDVYQQAINEQCRLMLGAKSEKVRSEAANSLLSHLKPPEAQKINLDVNIREDDSVRELRQGMLELVAEQRKILEARGMTATQMAESKLVTAEYEIVDDVN